MSLQHKLTSSRPLRFVLVGGLATVIHFAILVALVEGAGVGPTAATTAGYLTSAAVNYAVNRSFTFRSAAAHLNAAPKFAAMCLAGVTLNAALLWTLIQFGLHYIPSQILTTAVVVAFNYSVASRWVFPGTHRVPDEPA